jgi:hypothetical protein
MVLRGRLSSRVLVRVGACAAAVVGVVSVACITTVPDLVVPPLTRPTIERGAVQPPEDTVVDWPVDGTFSIPVYVTTPGETFAYEFVYDSTTPYAFVVDLTPDQVAADGGTMLVTRTLARPDTIGTQPDVCPHSLDFIVGHSIPLDSVGGDFARWWYYNGGNGVCPLLDAGSGVLPLTDASTDALLVVGGDP